MDSITFREIQHGSVEYQRMLDLRLDYLGRPIGLTRLEAKDTQHEEQHVHLAAFDGDRIVGGCILIPQGDVFKLRQMFVVTSLHGQKIGVRLLAYAEEVARAKAATEIYMNARKAVMAFYQGAGYQVEGDEFTEVGIPHFRMAKVV